jgi:hypothetical protein
LSNDEMAEAGSGEWAAVQKPPVSLDPELEFKAGIPQLWA